MASIGSTMLLTFMAYGSISHDLAHRTLRLPVVLNEGLLCAIELIAFRCGHAYRITHLHHHKRFPAVDDLEGAAARMTWWRPAGNHDPHRCAIAPIMVNDGDVESAAHTAAA